METKFLGLIKKGFLENWDKPALTDLYDDRTYTYKQFAEKITKLHIIFQSLSLQKGDKIAICDKNSSHWAIAFFASMSYGAVVTTILNDFHIDSIESIINHSDSKILFVGDQTQAALNDDNIPKASTIIHLENFEIIKTDIPQAKKTQKNIDKIFASKYINGFTKDDLFFHDETPEDLAMLNYTSGTTSSPKGVMLPYRSLWSNTRFAIDNMHAVKSGDGVICMLPMAHMYGLAFEVLLSVTKGCHIFCLSRVPSPQILLSAFAKVNPTLVLTVPLILEKIIQSKVMPELKKFPINIFSKVPFIKNIIHKKILKKLKPIFGKKLIEMIVGGAAMNQEVGHFLSSIRFPYTVGYGMTECGPLIAYAPWNEYIPGSCGKAVDRMEIKIVSSAKPESIPGDILVKGDNVMLGYYKNEEATQEAFTEDGWLKTGDLGIIDKNKNLFIKGRSKTMILGATGQNIYPEEIEDFYKDVPLIAEVLVIDENHKLIALIYPDENYAKENNITDIKGALLKNMIEINKKLPNYSKISNIRVMEKDFEKTPKRSIKRFLYQK